MLDGLGEAPFSHRGFIIWQVSVPGRSLPLAPSSAPEPDVMAAPDPEAVN
jgi:hypothetical protein